MSRLCRGIYICSFAASAPSIDKDGFSTTSSHPVCPHRRTMDAQGKALSSSTSSPDSHCLPLLLPPDFPFLPSSPNYYFQSMARLSCSTPLSQTRKSVLGPFSGIIRHTKRSLYHTRAFACSSFFLSVVSRCFILLIPVPEIARPNLFTPI